jgi:hypothetical protein
MNTPKELKVSGRGVSAWNDAKKRADDNLAAMWREAYKMGAKAFHPDDGWVDRKNGTLRLQYPFVRLPNIKAGDLIAVTDYVSYKMVKVVETSSDPNLFLIEKEIPKNEYDNDSILIGSFLILCLIIYGIFLAIKG